MDVHESAQCILPDLDPALYLTIRHRIAEDHRIESRLGTPELCDVAAVDSLT